MLFKSSQGDEVMKIDWGKVAKGLAEVAVAGTAAYVSYKIIEAAVDELLAAPVPEAARYLAERVPGMSPTEWSAFHDLLDRKARPYTDDQDLLLIARSVRKVAGDVDAVLADGNAKNGADTLEGLLALADQHTRLAYYMLLAVQADRNNITARSIKGHLSNRGLLSG
jgi:hypothetical protein